MRRGLGWLPNPYDPRDADFKLDGLLKGPTSRAAGFPDAYSLASYRGSTYDQGGLGSCVAQAVAKMLEMYFRIVGVPDPVRVSTLAIYNLARASHKMLLWDMGTTFRAALEVIRKLGIMPEHAFPYTDSHMPIAHRDKAAYQILPPTMGMMMAADTTTKAAPTEVLYRGLSATGDARILALMETLAIINRPVGFGTAVSADFVNGGDHDVVDKPKATDTIAGGHAMVLIGYKDGGALWQVQNSWGGNGTFWMTAEYLVWEQTRDISVIEKAPMWKEAA